jgi:hypothetical protein
MLFLMTCNDCHIAGIQCKPFVWNRFVSQGYKLDFIISATSREGARCLPVLWLQSLTHCHILPQVNTGDSLCTHLLYAFLFQCHDGCQCHICGHNRSCMRCFPDLPQKSCYFSSMLSVCSVHFPFLHMVYNERCLYLLCTNIAPHFVYILSVYLY